MTAHRPEPPAPFIARPQVSAFLDAVPDTPVNLMVAPAGTGKTAAAAAWTVQRPDSPPVTWVRLGSSGTGARLPEEPTRPGPGPAPIVVVDDAQTLDRHAVAVLARLLRRSPDTQRLLFLSRTELAFIPVELAVAGRVNTLGFPELRFQDSEAAALVRAHHPGASEQQVQAVLEHSAGWAAALVLGARSLHGHTESPVLAGPAPRPILDYLSSEVFETFPSALRQVLTAVCQETDVTEEDAIVLSGVPEAPDLLAATAADGLMVTTCRNAAAPGGRLWRLHPLLGEVLRRRTAPDGPDWSIVSSAHDRAARHHARAGNAAPAVQHAAMAGDLVLQLEMLQEFALELLVRGQRSLVRASLALVPPELRESSRHLQALDALNLREEQLYDAAKRTADRALSPSGSEDGPAGSPDVRNLEVDLAILDVWEAHCGWRPPGRALDRAALALHCHHDEHVPDDDASIGHDTTGVSPLRSAWLMLDLAVLEIWTDDLPSAGVHLEAAARYADGVGIARLTNAVLSVRASLHLARGAYQTAARSADGCLRLHAESGQLEDTISTRAHLVRGWGRFHALDLDGAASDLADFTTHPHDPFDPLLQMYARLLEANLLTAGGEMDEARRVLDGDAEVAGRFPAFLRRHMSFAQFRAAGFMGDLAAMETQARNLRRAGFDLDADLADAIIRGLNGDERQAVRELDRLLADPEPPSSDGTVELPRVTAASAAVSRVAFLQRIDTPATVDRATSLVPDMLTRIAPQKLLWLLSTGQLITPTFTRLLDAEVARAGGHPFATEAREALRRHPRPYPDQTPHETGGHSEGIDRHQLTDRELDMLRALTDGGSNVAIARAFFISENTVKTHLSAVYRKLGVTSRREALDTARREGLL